MSGGIGDGPAHSDEKPRQYAQHQEPPSGGLCLGESGGSIVFTVSIGVNRFTTHLQKEFPISILESTGDCNPGFSSLTEDGNKIEIWEIEG